MTVDQYRDRQLLSVVSIAHAQLPAAALLLDHSHSETERNFNLQAEAVQHAQATSHQRRLADLGRSLCYADNPRLAADAYAMALRVVNRDHHAGRVFLDDLAEWLVIPPSVYRKLQKDANITTAQAA